MQKYHIKHWIYLFAGSILIAISFVLFFTPYSIVPGGVYGAGVALNHLFPGIDVGTFGLMIDIPLLIISFLIFGGKFGAKTIVAALVIPLVMNGMTWMIDDANPITMLGGKIDLSGDVMLACLIGGVIMGVGVALILKSNATSGGTDVVAMIVSKYVRIPISRSLLLVDSVVVIFGLIVFGDWKVPLYSLLTIFVMSQVVDFIIDGGSGDKLVFILSERTDFIRGFILDEMSRGGTIIKSAGMYSESPKDMIFVVVSRRQISMLQDFVRKTDPKAFMVVVNAHETLGDGFQEFKPKVGG